MTKSLIDKLQGGFRSVGRGLKRTALAVIAGAFLYGAQCVPNPPKPEPEPDNNKPEAILYVNPVSGQAPLEVLIQLDGIDDKKEIIEYKVEIDRGGDGSIEERIIQEEPIYITKTFNEDAIVYGEVKNSCDVTDRKKAMIDVYHVNDGVPNNQPVITSSPLTEINEGQIYNYDVDARDADAGDVLTYSLTQKPSWLSIDPSSGLITGKAPSTSSDVSYDIIVKVSDGKDETLQAYTLNVYNLLDIQGVLQDNVTDTGKRGIVGAYLSDGTTLLKQTITNANGEFELSLNEQVPEILLKARIMQDNSPISFERKIMLAENEVEGFRTIHFSGQDVTGLILRASPYEQILAEGITPEQYKIHMGEVNLEKGYPVYGLKKFNWDNFQGIEVENQHPGGTEFGTFTPEMQTHYRDKILALDDIGYYLHGRAINIQLDDSNSNEHYDKYGEGKDTVIIPHNGWIVIVPDNTLEGTIAAFTKPYDVNKDGKIDRVKIHMKDQGDPIFTKEMTRAFLGMTGDSTVISGDKTIMIPSPILPMPSPIDKRSSHDIDEPNYEPKEYIDNIYGL